MPKWVRFVPFFLSAFLFLSGLFTLFAPLPLLLLSMGAGQRRRAWLWLATLTNGVTVGVLGGNLSLGLYVVFVAAVGLSLPELLTRRMKLERVVLGTLGMMLGTALLFIVVYAQWKQINPIQEIQAQVSRLFDYVAANLSSESRQQWIGDADPAEWKRSFLVELPSAIAVFALVLVWSNLLALLRLNPGGLLQRLGLDASFFRTWKASELLVWPTILSGAFLVVDAGWVSDVAINIFRFLMAVYAIQGLSILSFLFDVWGVRGLFRSLGHLVAVFLMLPLLLSLGFFDLWFDFRAKLRQS